MYSGKNFMRRIMSFILSFVLVVILVPTYSSAEAGIINESELNDTWTTATRTYDDYTNKGTFYGLGDIDWWKIRFSNRGMVNIYLGNIPSGCNYDIELYIDDYENPIAWSKKTTGTYEFMQCRVEANIDYYVKLETKRSTSSTQSYQLRFKIYDIGNANTFTYDPIESRSTGTEFGGTRQINTIVAPKLMTMGYTVYGNPNRMVDVAYEQFPSSSFFLIANHANPGYITLHNTSGHKSFLAGTQSSARTISPGDELTVLPGTVMKVSDYSSGALSQAKVVLYMGCYSGVTSQYYGNLVDITLQKGAAVCIGWNDLIGSIDLEAWTRKFMEYCADGECISNAIDKTEYYIAHSEYYASVSDIYCGTSNITGIIP